MAGTFWQDLRLAVRGFARAPGFLAVAVVTLALGVGANTAVFSVVNAIYLKPLDFADPDRLVLIGRSAEDGSYRMATQSPGAFMDWARGQTPFQAFAGYRYWTTTLERDGVAARVNAVHSVGSLFDVLGVAAAQGRTFAAEEEGPGHEALVVLSHAYWQREFGAADPVGQTMVLDGVPHDIIGVMPEHFRFPDASTDLWKTADLSAEELLERGDSFMNTVARLAPNRTLDQAREEMARLHEALRSQDPLRLGGSIPEVTPLRETLLGDIGSLWVTLMAAVGFVLLIACVNLAHLLLSRAHARSGEIALRRALGASRGRVVRQIMTEGVVLAFAGGLAAVGAGWLMLRGVLAWMPGGVPRAEVVGIDGKVLAFTLAIAMAAGIASGFWPALKLSEQTLGSTIGARRGGQGRGLRRLLVAAEVAMAVVLVVGAGIAVRGFMATSALAPGFEPSERTVFHVELQGDVGDEETGTFYETLQSQVSALAGVRSSGVTSVYPMAGFTPGSSVGRPGEPVGRGAPTVRYVGVSPTFRAAAGIPLLAGRDLSQDDGRHGNPAILLSRSAADLLFPDGVALGKEVYLGPGGVVAPASTIVGVVGDVRQRGMTQPAPPMAYVPRENIAFWRGYDLVVEAQGTASAILAEQVRTLARDLDARAVVLTPTHAESFVSDAMTGQRNVTLLFALMGMIALTLAMVGVFGVVSFFVGQRSKEIGIRIAVGAGSTGLQWLILRQSLVAVAAGILVGLAGATALSRFMEGLVVGIDPLDPVPLALLPVVIIGVASLAAWLPARRAARVDPLRVLSEG